MFYMFHELLSHSIPLDTENIELLLRGIDYYSKSLKNLEEIEQPNETIPLFENQIERSILEVESIKKILTSEIMYDINFSPETTKFIIKILNFYKNELHEDLEEIELTEGKDSDINALLKEMDKIDEFLKSIFLYK